jgi:hypothetical protein
MSAKMPQDKFVTPIVTLVWPHVHAPDTKFVKDGEDAKYNTQFSLSKDEAAPIISTAKRLINEARKSKLTKAPPKLPFTENEDGTVTFKCASKNAPALFDASGTPLKPGMKVGGGTLARISGLMRVYEGFGATGVTLYLNAMQIIDLKEFGGRPATSYGFDATTGFTGDTFGEDEDAEQDPFAEEADEDPDADF